MGFLDSPQVKHHYLSQSNMLNNGQQTEDDPMPSDEEIEELFSKGKCFYSFPYCKPVCCEQRVLQL